jgi:hypothetical protein
MKFRVLIAAIIFGIALPAAADFKTIAEAYEVALADLRVPQSESGTVSFKACGECAYQTKPVSENTQWILNGKNLSLDQFRRGLLSITDRKATSVTVLHHLEEDRVTRVEVNTY